MWRKTVPSGLGRGKRNRPRDDGRCRTISPPTEVQGNVLPMKPSQRESRGSWKNFVYVLSILYPVKGNPIPRFDLAANPVITYSYSIVVPITLHFPNIKFVRRTIHSWKIFENEFFYSFAVGGRQFRQIP